MAFTKEQRLLVLMAIACMGLAVVSAGCMDKQESIGSYRFDLILNAKNESDDWCSCAMTHPVNYTEKCDDQSFYEKANSFVKCTSFDDFKALVSPLGFCGGFKNIIANLSTVLPATSEDDTIKPDDLNSSSNVPNATDANTTLPEVANPNNASPETPKNTSPETPNNTSPKTPNNTSPETPNNTLTVAPKPNSTSPESGPAITTSTPEDLTYLAWLIPLILLLVAAMLGLGCYLHRRTKGARGFHHSTKTNGSTKATNGEA